MKSIIIALILCFLGYANSSLSVQDYVDKILSNLNNKIEIIENNVELINHIYEYFKQEHGRDTSRMIDLKEDKRVEIFKSNLKYIIKHNDNSSKTFKLKINEMSDWTDEERDKLRSNIINEPINNEKPIESRDEIILPQEFDWTNQTRIPYAVTPVKDQRHCGSCYAFAMVGALEKTYAQIYNQSGPLSPQQIVDCSTSTSGCEGGSFIGTFNYIQRNGFRLNLEKDYPSTFDGKQQEKCLKSNGELLSFNSTFTLQYQQLPTENEEYMKQILYQKGPIYFSFNCGLRQGNDTILRQVSDQFDHYSTGVFDVPGCPTHRNMNHAFFIVG